MSRERKDLPILAEKYGTTLAGNEVRGVRGVRICSQLRWTESGPWGSESCLKMQGGGERVNYKSFPPFHSQVLLPCGSRGDSAGKCVWSVMKETGVPRSPLHRSLVFCPPWGRGLAPFASGPNLCGQGLNSLLRVAKGSTGHWHQASALCAGLICISVDFRGEQRVHRGALKTSLGGTWHLGLGWRGEVAEIAGEPEEAWSLSH